MMIESVWLFFGSFLLLGFWPMVAIVVFGVAMLFCTILDRRSRPEPKWFVISIGAIVWFFYSWIATGSPTLVLSNLFTVASLTAVLWYFGIGLVYSIVELVFEIVRATRIWRASWGHFLQKPCAGLVNDNDWILYPDRGDATLKMKDLLLSAKSSPVGAKLKAIRDGITDGNNRPVYDYVSSKLAGFAAENTHHNTMVHVEQLASDPLTLTPRINKAVLTSNIGAWTTFWPFYAASMLFGNLLEEIFRVISNMLVKIFDRLVRLGFANVFKV